MKYTARDLLARSKTTADPLDPGITVRENMAQNPDHTYDGMVLSLRRKPGRLRLLKAYRSGPEATQHALDTSKEIARVTLDKTFKIVWK